MAKKNKKSRTAAGLSKKGPAARVSKKARKAKAARVFETAKAIAKRDRPRMTDPNHPARVKARKGAAAKATTKARPSSTEVPLGKGKLSYVRFDTPKSKLIHAAVEKYAKGQHPGVPMKTVFFNLMKIGLEVLTGKGNVFKPDAAEKTTDLQKPIEDWAAKKWPEPEDRPTLKGLIFQVLAAGLETAAHVTAAALSTVGKRAPSKPKKPSTDPTKRTKSGNPKRPPRAASSKAAGKATRAAKKGGGPRLSREGAQELPGDDVPAINRNEPNDDAERNEDEE